MFTAADLLEALRQRRKLKSIRPEVPGQLPPGWEAWLAAMPARIGAVTGAPPQAFVDVLLGRPLARPPRSLSQLTRWQAFSTLWRQQWHAAPREERWQRVVAVLVSGVLHVVFGVLLLVFAYLRFMALPPPAGDTVVQAEFIGRGTPETPGGGEPAAEPAPPAPAEPTAQAPAAAAAPTREVALPPEPAFAAPELSADAPPVAVREVPEPEPQPQPESQPQPPPPAEQPLQVTEVQAPDTEFVLPPPRPRREPTLPRVRTPEVRMPTPEVAVVDVPPPVTTTVRDVPQREAVVREVRVEAPEVATREVPEPLQRREMREVAQRGVAVRDVRTQVPAVATRDVPEPLQRREMRGVAARETAAPEVRATTPGVAVRDVPMPAGPSQAAAPGAAQPGPATTAAPAAGTTPGATGTAPTPAPPGRPTAERGTTPATAAPGAGPGSTPGTRPGPSRADDWGDAARTRPGGPPGRAPGLFNADGTVRVPDAAAGPGPGSAPGSAPGTVEQRIADLDKAGVWLKRPPFDYTPTRFDRFWIPHGSLLDEWVRRGIKNVSIPIPGTSKRIQCAVSLLQLGGACGISDPNLNEQPATARPPPDIPFKPELQEDNGSR